jgi:serine/threonine protein kinase
MSVFDRLAAALAERYRIERELGAGGMATVYLAEDLKHHREVAIKVLKPELAAVLGAERFIQEITTTAQLQHPHILPLFDSGTADGFLFYVMPYVEGETLRDKLSRETQLGVEEAVRITREVADALDYAHRHGVIHRDIKPENILLHDGRPMVADFGIALAVSAAAGGRMTETGMSLGTPHYMSPEQATADKEITGRADVYSLASVLYEMLTGDPPHVGSSAQQIIVKIIADEARPVGEVRKSVPANVAAALAKALEKLPADRFESAKAFADALADPHFATASAASAGLSTPAGGRGLRQLVRNPWWWGTVAVAAGAVAVAIVGTHRLAPSSPPWFTARTFDSRSILNARFMPDGQTIVFSGLPNVGRVSRVYVIRPDHPDPVPFGPDSTHLLNVSSTGVLAVLTHASYLVSHRLFLGTLATFSLGGEAPHEVTTGVREADWGPGGKTMAVIRDSSGTDLLEYPVGTVLVRSQGYLSDPRISPDGDAIAYVQHPAKFDDRGFAVIADRTGRTLARSGDFTGIEGTAWRPDGKSIFYSASGGGASGVADYAVRRLDRSGRDGWALSGPGGLTVQDVSRQGRVLLTDDRQMYRIFGRGPDSPTETDMGVRDLSDRPVLSADGRYLAFSDQSSMGGPDYSVLWRKTDGSPPVRLGEGNPLAVSRDDGMVLAGITTTPAKLMLYPTGPGAARRLDSGQFQILHIGGGEVHVTGRDTIVFFCATEPRQAERCFVDSLPHGSPIAVTPPGTSQAILSPDGRAVLAQVGDSMAIYPLGSGARRPALGLRPGDDLVRWSPDGHDVWVWTDPSSASSLDFDRVDLLTGARARLLTVVPRALGGVRGFEWPTLADDPHVYAYNQFLYTSLLYTVDGLR